MRLDESEAMAMDRYIIASVCVTREGPHHVAECPELGLSSFALTEGEAVAKLMDATERYLDTLRDLGECDQTLREKGVEVYHGGAAAKTLPNRPGSVCLAAVFPLESLAIA
jgi:hypothetical protein